MLTNTDTDTDYKVSNMVNISTPIIRYCSLVSEWDKAEYNDESNYERNAEC